MTRTHKHVNSKPCGKECPICYPINPKTARTRRRNNRQIVKDELSEAMKIEEVDDAK